MRITPVRKKWIAVISMVLLAAYTITSPINLKEMLPAWISSPTIGQFSLVNIAAYVVLISAYWVMNPKNHLP